MPFPAMSPTSGCRAHLAPSDWWAAAVHLDTAAFSFSPSPFAYSSESSWILMSWLRAQWVPVAAGHCGKLAPSLIVIRRPSSVPIKIRKDDTYGGTCSSKDVCMMRWRGRVNVYVCMSMFLRARVCTSRATRPLRCYGNLYHQSAWG